MRLWRSGVDELRCDVHEDDDASCDHYLFTCTNIGISLNSVGLSVCIQWCELCTLGGLVTGLSGHV